VKAKNLSMPEIGLIAMTRVVLGVGIGLLLAEKLNADQRKSVGCALLAVGALSTLPIAAQVLGKQAERRPELEEVSASI
jgi:hypothetical protein